MAVQDDIARDIDSAKATDEPTDAVSGPTTRRTALGLAAGFLGIEFGLKPSGAEIPIHLYREGPEELRYNDLEVGEGAEPQKGDLVTCSFEGTVVQTGERFDVGQSVSFQVGNGEVIEAWDIALLGGKNMPRMKVGGTRQIRVTPDLAYGKVGAGCTMAAPRDIPSKVAGGVTKCVIPPNAEVDFIIKLDNVA
jgi:hypothetical protein